MCLVYLVCCECSTTIRCTLQKMPYSQRVPYFLIDASLRKVLPSRISLTHGTLLTLPTLPHPPSFSLTLPHAFSLSLTLPHPSSQSPSHHPLTTLSPLCPPRHFPPSLYLILSHFPSRPHIPSPRRALPLHHFPTGDPLYRYQGIITVALEIA